MLGHVAAIRLTPSRFMRALVPSAFRCRHTQSDDPATSILPQLCNSCDTLGLFADEVYLLRNITEEQLSGLAMSRIPTAQKFTLAPHKSREDLRRL